MDVWVDLDSGTWGSGHTASIYLNPDEADTFGELSDSDRVAVTRAMLENADDPAFDFTSALAACDL